MCLLIQNPLGYRLVTLASGAAAGKFLQYEAVAPTVAAQTAYGIECEVRQAPADLSIHPDRPCWQRLAHRHT